MQERGGETMRETPIDGSDFGSNYWRGAPTLPDNVAPTTSTLIDDTVFRLLADNIPTLCWIANGDGYIFWYNRRWHEYCGSTPEQMEGWGWQSVHDPAKLDAVNGVVDAGVELIGKPYTIEELAARVRTVLDQ